MASKKQKDLEKAEKSLNISKGIRPNKF